MATDTTQSNLLDQVPTAPKWYLISDASGRGSVTVTLVMVSFWVTTAIYIASSFEKLGPVTMRPFDVGAVAAYFAPILATYVSRRFTDAKYPPDQAVKS